MKKKIATLLSLVMLGNGCASVNPITGSIDDLPIIPFSEKPPEDGKFILHFPKAIPIETPITFGGNLFIEDDVQILTVLPKQDIYLYRDWVSYDLKRWQNAEETLRTDLKIKLPGYDHPRPGYLHLRLDKTGQ